MDLDLAQDDRAARAVSGREHANVAALRRARQPHVVRQARGLGERLDGPPGGCVGGNLDRGLGREGGMETLRFFTEEKNVPIENTKKSLSIFL